MLNLRINFVCARKSVLPLKSQIIDHSRTLHWPVGTQSSHGRARTPERNSGAANVIILAIANVFITAPGQKAVMYFYRLNVFHAQWPKISTLVP